MNRSIDADALRRLGADLLVQAGVPAADARLLADTLVTAEQWGHASHGMLRLPWYLARLRSGAMTAVTQSQLVLDNGAVAVIDGRDGIGQVLAQEATRVGIARAQAHGVSVVAVRNSNHFGTAAYFTRQCAHQGCIGVLATNASPAMAPWGGRTKALGTNPWSIAAPAGARGVVVMDIANTAVARGKIYAAAQRNEAIPAGWAADGRGVPTTDAHTALQGLILPMAGHKGYIISFMMDVLAGVLTGSAFGAGVAGPYVADRASGCGHLFITIQIDALMPRAQFEQRLARLIEEVKAVPRAAGIEEIFFPGEIEARRCAESRTRGLSIPEQTWKTLSELAAQSTVAMPGIRAAAGPAECGPS
jgi:LDH2 family malate/lactate/ureidoglycolate dehydrogenase